MSEDRSEWLRCRPWLEAALDHADGTHTMADIEAGIESGELQFWAGKRCAVVTAIHEYPRLKALGYFLVGGDLSELKDIEPRLAAWGKAHGCARVIAGGRPGFSRVMPAGFRAKGMYYTKELSP